MYFEEKKKSDEKEERSFEFGMKSTIHSFSGVWRTQVIDTDFICEKNTLHLFDNALPIQKRIDLNGNLIGNFVAFADGIFCLGHDLAFMVPSSPHITFVQMNIMFKHYWHCIKFNLTIQIKHQLS